MSTRYGRKGNIHTKPQVVGGRKHWKQYKNVENWITSRAVEAVSEHQWQDAGTLLPCITIRSQPVTPADFVFKLIHTVLVNTQHDTSELDQYFMRNSFVLGANHFEIGLTALAEEIIGGSQEGVDSIFEMIDDCHSKYSKATKSRSHQPLQEQEHWQTLVWSYKGLLLYAKWKSMKKEKKDGHKDMNIFGTDSQITANSQILSQMSAISVTQSSSALAQEAYAALHKAVEKSLPCEWLLSPYLELKRDIEGENSVLMFLQNYVSEYNDHLPAYLFAYHFMKKNIAMSEEVQRIALQGISRMNPANPLVLTYVEDLLKLVNHNEIEQTNIEITEDSGLEDEDVDNASSGQENSTKERSHNPNCFLRREKVVGILISCIRKIKTLIEHKQWHWNPEPWRLLTHIFRKIHMAWICCWYCPSCIFIRKKISYLSRSVLKLWKVTFWTNLPDILTKSGAEVLMHSAYASYMFNYDISFVYMVIGKLKPEFLEYADQLDKFINMKGKFATKYMEYRSRKTTLLSARTASFWNTAALEQSSSGKENEVRGFGVLKENTGFHDIVNSEAKEKLRLLEKRLTGSLKTVRENLAQKQGRPETPNAGIHKSNGNKHMAGQSPAISRFTPLMSDDSSSEFQPPKRKLKGGTTEKCKSKVLKKVSHKKERHDKQVVKQKTKLPESQSAKLASTEVDVHEMESETAHQLPEDLFLEKNQESQKNNHAVYSQCESTSLLDYSRKVKGQVIENESGNQEVFNDGQVMLDEDNLMARDDEKLWGIEEENAMITSNRSKTSCRTSPYGISSTDTLSSNIGGIEENIFSGYSHLPYSQEDLQNDQNRSLDYTQVASKNVNSFGEPFIIDKEDIDIDYCENEIEKTEECPADNDTLSSDLKKSVEMECEINPLSKEEPSGHLSLNIESVYSIAKEEDHNIMNEEVSDDEIITSSLPCNTSLSPKLSQYRSKRKRSVESPLTRTNVNVASTVCDSQPLPLSSLQFRTNVRSCDHSTPIERTCRSRIPSSSLDLRSCAQLVEDNDCDVEPEVQGYSVINNKDFTSASCNQTSPVLPCRSYETDSSKFSESNTTIVPKYNVNKKREIGESQISSKSFDFTDLPFPFGNESEENPNKRKNTKKSKGMDDCQVTQVTLNHSLNVFCERKKKKKKNKKSKNTKTKPKNNCSEENNDSPMLIDPTIPSGNGENYSKTSVGENSTAVSEVRNNSKTDKSENLQEVESKTAKKSRSKSKKRCAKIDAISLEVTKGTGKCSNDNDGHRNTLNKQSEIPTKETDIGGSLDLGPKDKKKSKVKYKQADKGIGCHEKKLEIFENRKKELAKAGALLEHTKESGDTEVLINVSGETKKMTSNKADVTGGGSLVLDIKKSNKKNKKSMRKCKTLDGDEVMDSGKGISKNLENGKKKCTSVTQEANGCLVDTNKSKEASLITNTDEAVNMNSELITMKKLKKKKKNSKRCKDGISDKPGMSINKIEKEKPAVTNKERNWSEIESIEKSLQSQLLCNTKKKTKSKQKGFVNVDKSLPECAGIDEGAGQKKSDSKQSGKKKVKKTESSSVAKFADEKIMVSPKSKKNKEGSSPKSKKNKEGSSPKTVTKKFWYQEDYFSDLPLPFPI
ncbi:uncharacterized protein LOC143034018 [Oratosquilla oratoria]|uniref:uncharacterized protein LOC143034018 n=1 Tax=Oratosquilla oratoria TaxID=337810 RepID=UPI003F76A13B